MVTNVKICRGNRSKISRARPVARLRYLAAYGVIRYGLSEIEPIARGAMMQGLGAALFFFLVLNNVRHRWHVTVVAWALVGTGTLVAVCALWQVLLGGTWVWAFPQYDQY